MSMVGYLQTGNFLTPTISVPDPTGTRFTTAATRPNVTIRPDQLRDPQLADPTIDRVVRRRRIRRAADRPLRHRRPRRD